MDAVILAAGKGSRLEGIAAPYHKPLMVINGKSLIRQCVEHAFAVADHVTIVAAPENVLPITQVIGVANDRRLDIIVQPSPDGPGDALRRGLKLSTSVETVVLMGDNVMHASDVERIANSEDHNVIGVRAIAPSHDAQRFTRYDATTSRWVEKIPFSEKERSSESLVWVGPIKVCTREMYTALTNVRAGDSAEVPIGPFFNDLTDVKVEKVDAFDIGVPEALT